MVSDGRKAAVADSEVAASEAWVILRCRPCDGLLQKSSRATRERSSAGRKAATRSAAAARARRQGASGRPSPRPTRAAFAPAEDAFAIAGAMERQQAT